MGSCLALMEIWLQIPGRTVLVGLRGQRDVAEEPRKGGKRLRWTERSRGSWSPSSCEAIGPAHGVAHVSSSTHLLIS